MSSDSVGLDEAVARAATDEAGNSGASDGARKKLRPLAANLKIVVSLFLCFVLVVSDVFTASVVGGFRGAVHCRVPTTWGTAIQGIFLVLFMILVVHLVDAGIV